MKYIYAQDIQDIASEISSFLFPHINMDYVKCFRSYGTSSRRTIARCHGLSKIMQKTLNIKAFYALEFLTEHFDRLNQEEKIKVIIHELMHIPFSFGGGFKQHDIVNEKNVNKNYLLYLKLKNEKEKNNYFFK
jgi:predicted metallopeptidase